MDSTLATASDQFRIHPVLAGDAIDESSYPGREAAPFCESSVARPTPAVWESWAGAMAMIAEYWRMMRLPSGPMKLSISPPIDVGHTDQGEQAAGRNHVSVQVPTGRVLIFVGVTIGTGVG